MIHLHHKFNCQPKNYRILMDFASYVMLSLGFLKWGYPQKSSK